MTNEVKKVPELRFPEFDGEWEETRADELFSSISDKNHSGMLQPLSATQDRGMVLREELDKDIQFNNKSLKSYKKTLPGDFIISLRSFQGGFEYNNLLGLVSPAYTVLRKNDDNIDVMFFKYYFKRSWFIKKLDSMIYGIRDGKSISFNDFSTFKINISSLNEQQKIGEFFSKLDQQIELEEQKLEKLEEQKKGYMQKIFSQELSFKDKHGNSYPNWKELNFFDVLDKIIDFRGRTPKKLNMDWSNAGYLALSAVNVKKGYIDYNVEAKYGGKELYKKWMKGNELQKGQVLFTTEAPMGNVAQVPDNKGYILSQRTIAFNTNEKITNDFLASLLSSKKVYNKLLRLSSGATAKGVSQKTLKSLYVTIPISIEEQQKIGEFFKKIDNLINKQFNKVYLLKERKKGFLQKMFV